MQYLMALNPLKTFVPELAPPLFLAFTRLSESLRCSCAHPSFRLVANAPDNW
jgi:hypothetical protein